MYVTSVTQSEIRLTLDATVDIANALDSETTPAKTTPDAATPDDAALDAAAVDDEANAAAVTSPVDRLRDVLDSAGFSRAADASEAAMVRLEQRMRNLLPLLQRFPDQTSESLLPQINAELDSLPISPSMVDHDGIGLHLHWTPASATFDDQIMSDVLIAIAQELCDNDTSRFGRCAAHDCEDLFYDGTRNRSKRFCADPRCAGRTHTADHRARQRESS